MVSQQPDRPELLITFGSRDVLKVFFPVLDGPRKPNPGVGPQQFPFPHPNPITALATAAVVSRSPPVDVQLPAGLLAATCQRVKHGTRNKAKVHGYARVVARIDRRPVETRRPSKVLDRAVLPRDGVPILTPHATFQEQGSGSANFRQRHVKVDAARMMTVGDIGVRTNAEFARLHDP